MNETTFNWDDLRLFLAVARAGGLAAAADKTGKSPPTLGRRMLELEKQLGQELFYRLPRGYELTENGRVLLEKVNNLENSIDPLTASADGVRVRRVKISAGTWVTHLLSQNISQLMVDHHLKVQFISADHVLDISHREAIIGVRNQRPTQISLAGRHTQKIQFAVYAANKKVKPWALVTGSTPSAQWAREQANNAVKVVLPTFIGDTNTTLMRMSKPIKELEHMQWLVMHQDERHAPEVRRVLDWMLSTLGTSD